MHVIDHIIYRCVEKYADSLVGSGATVLEKNCVLSSVTHDGITVRPNILNDCISGILLNILYEIQTNSNAPNNILMLHLSHVFPKLKHNLQQLLSVCYRWDGRGGGSIPSP